LSGLVVTIAIFRWKVLPPTLFVVRDVLRNDPAAREAFVGKGNWIAISRRFGVPYVASAFVASLGWLLLVAQLVPDTALGAWLLFAPAIAFIILGVLLGALRVARWMADES
jgi:hypothetical protein